MKYFYSLFFLIVAIILLILIIILSYINDKNDKKDKNIVPLRSIKEIKKKEVLIYNGFSYHYEMFGFILDFCNVYDIEATVVNIKKNDDWFDLYKQKYNFKYLDKLPPSNELDDYLFVLLLTNIDTSFPNDYITSNVICIDHDLNNERPLIKYHLLTAPFKQNMNYALPIFEYINYETKIEILKKNNRPIIAFVGGNSIPSNLSKLSKIINIDKFDLYIINRHISKKLYSSKLPNVYFFENISAIKMFELLTKTNYICYYTANSKSHLQINNKVITACVPLSFSTGCKLIIPKKMNKCFQFKSIITYNKYGKFYVNESPSLLDTFEERNQLIQTRDINLFKLPHLAKNKYMFL